MSRKRELIFQAHSQQRVISACVRTRVHLHQLKPKACIPNRDRALLVIQTANVMGAQWAWSPLLNVACNVVFVFIFNLGQYKNSKRDYGES